MVTPEERITRLEALQEANVQRFDDVNARLDTIIRGNDAARQEAREANQALRQEMQEANQALRQEMQEANQALRQEMQEASQALRQDTRDMNESTRREMLQLVEAARKESRTYFLAMLSLGAILMAATITTTVTVLGTLPG